MKFKKYEYVDVETGEVSFYFVGATSDIKTLYKAIRRASYKGSTNYWHYDMDTPKFSSYKSVYALCIDSDGSFHILNSDTMLALIVGGVVTEV